jgi:dTDP-4-amino-4,6-dideoxygalactose transaminase
MFVNGVEGDVACFSSYIAHLLVTGVGGFICTNDDKLAVVMRSMMFHGRDESYLNIDDRPDDVSKRFWFPRFGYSDRMTELEAALGLGELDGWEDMIRERQENAYSLTLGLGDICTFPFNDIFNHAFMFFPLFVERRDELMVYLEARGIQTRTMMPLTTQPVVQPYIKKKYPGADYVNAHGLLLPGHQYLNKSDLNHIINCVRNFYE